MMFFYWWVFVQIVVESLPVSSSGHQKLFERLLVILSPHALYVPDNIAATMMLDSLLHVLHIPTMIVIAIFFYSRWSVLIYNWVRCLPIITRTVIYGGIADSVTIIWYLFFKTVNIPVPLCVGFFITASLLFSLRWCPTSSNTRLNIRTSLLLGCAQGIALIPGISRFAITVVSALWLGFNKRAAFEISFMLQLPLIVSASVRGLYLLWSHNLLLSLFTVNMFLVLIISMAVAFLVLLMVSWLYKRNLLWLLGIYMIVPILVALVV